MMQQNRNRNFASLLHPLKLKNIFASLCNDTILTKAFNGDKKPALTFYKILQFHKNNSIK